MHDKKVLGVCGETSLSNSKHSIITMMQVRRLVVCYLNQSGLMNAPQVYEYFISHHLAKAFESLFGSVTCLPGCFTMYRLRTPDTQKPLFISNGVVQDYSENRVDTLHMKNLLHLGEDRYLTTLLLKHFPKYKTQFVRDAKAQTVAPDEWKVLLSQRRRWINSTVHNLAELVFLDRLCGFCCFSMRFIVLIDLVSTIIQPVTVAYVCSSYSFSFVEATNRVP
jgi:chitin synthase